MGFIGRRSFNAIVAALSLSRTALAGGEPVEEKSPSPESFVLSRNGWVPNNEDLPVILYRAVFEPRRRDPASHLEELFQRNGWPAQWRNGIYSFHHYHSTAHEALGIAKGEVTVILGGPDGKEFTLAVGDIVALPAGTGHKRISKRGGLLVIGAYPPGQRWDLIREEPEKKAAAVARIARVPLPESDPVLGGGGPLVRIWRDGARSACGQVRA